MANKGCWCTKERVSELLTIKDVSRILKVSQGTIRRMLDRGELKGVRVGRLWRIPQMEIDRFSCIKQEELENTR